MRDFDGGEAVDFKGLCEGRLEGSCFCDVGEVGMDET